MTDKHATLIINPNSGTRSKHGVKDYVCHRLGRIGYQVEVKTTQGPGEATQLAAEAAASGTDLVIAAGGDGTVNETAAGLCDTGTPLAILPLGSGNGFARSLNIPTDLRLAINIIEKGKIDTVDHGIVNGHKFFCTFGVGFDAAVSEKFAKDKRRGRTTYIKNTFLEYIKYNPQHYALSIGEDVIVEEAFLIAVCNASQYGNNAYIAPGARLDDGLLDIVVIHTGSLFKSAIMGVDLLTGHIDKNTLIQSFRAPAAVISRLKDGPVHLDGEPGLMGKKLSVECAPHSLKVMIPEKDNRFRPYITPMISMLEDLRYDLRALLKIR